MGLSAEEKQILDEEAPAEPGKAAADLAAEVDALAAGEEAAAASDGASPADGDAAASPPVEETAEQKAAREKDAEVGKRFQLVEQAKREHLKAVKRNAELDARAEQLSRLEEQYRSGLAQMQQQQAYFARLREGIQKGDVEVLKEFGYDYADLTRRQIEADSPAALARQALERQERLEQQIAQERAVNETRQVAQNLVQYVEDAPEEFPELYEWPPERIASEGIAARDYFRRSTGRMPTYDQVLKLLHRRASAEAEERKARAARLAQKREAATTKQSPKAATNGNGHQAARPQTPTLSNGVASAKGAPARQMTEAEIDEWALAELRRLSGGGSARSA